MICSCCRIGRLNDGVLKGLQIIKTFLFLLQATKFVALALELVKNSSLHTSFLLARIKGVNTGVKFFIMSMEFDKLSYDCPDHKNGIDFFMRLVKKCQNLISKVDFQRQKSF